MFKKDQISKMKEAEFQNSILIPLFRAMKFRDVTAFGGGSLELGKDIVMWKEGDVEERVNYGVVVKAVRISGKAKGKDTASEVLNQIRQCLTSEYPDPVTAQKQRVHRCFVVSSQIIEKSAINSIESQLRDFHFDKLVTWIHPGTNLYQLIEKHLPAQSIFEKLSKTQMDLDEIMKDVPYRIIGDTENKYTFKTKHEKATDELPFTINSNFKFDTKTPEGKKALEKFQEHFKKGSPVEIEGKHIESVNFPEFLPDFMKPANSEEAKLILQPIRGEHKLPISIKLTGEDGELAELDYIEAESIQQGTEEITFANDNQDVPWQVKITLGLVDRRFHIDFKFNMEMESLTLQQELICLKFIRCMKNGGKVKIKLLGKGLIIHEGDLPANPSLNVSDKWIEVIEKLIFIQTKAKTIFFKGNKFEVSHQEYEQIFYVADIMEDGKVEIPSQSLDLDADIEQAKSILDNFGDGIAKNLTFKPRETQKIQIWNTEIDLGIVVWFQSVYLDGKNIEKLRQDISKAKKDDLIKVHFTTNKEDPNTKIFYIDWLPVEEKEGFLKLPMFSENNL